MSVFSGDPDIDIVAVALAFIVSVIGFEFQARLVIGFYNRSVFDYFDGSQGGGADGAYGEGDRFPGGRAEAGTHKVII